MMMWRLGSILILALLIWGLFFCVADAQQINPWLKNVSGIIVTIDLSDSWLVIDTPDWKRIQVCVPPECKIIWNMKDGKLADFKPGWRVVASTFDDRASPIVAQTLADSESAWLMSLGRVTIYEYSGRILYVDPSSGRVILKLKPAGTKTILVTPSTDIQKNCSRAKLSSFSMGNEVYTELRFHGLPMYGSPDMTALYLYDPISYLNARLMATQGPFVLRGAVKNVDKGKAWFNIGGYTVVCNARTTWLVGRSFKGTRDLKGREVIIYSISRVVPSKNVIASAVLDLSAVNYILSTLEHHRGTVQVGSISILAEGTVSSVDRGRNRISVRNQDGEQITVRTSPGNTEFVYMDRPEEKGLTIDILKEGDRVRVEGYYPDQATRVTKQ